MNTVSLTHQLKRLRSDTVVPEEEGILREQLSALP